MRVTMTVGQLIEMLAKEDRDAVVLIAIDGSWRQTDSVDPATMTEVTKGQWLNIPPWTFLTDDPHPEALYGKYKGGVSFREVKCVVVS